jgi:uncharacterized protein
VTLPDSQTPARPVAGSVSLTPRTAAWLRPGLLLAGGLVVTDGLGHLLRIDGPSTLGLGALAGAWWLFGRRRPGVRPRLPDSLAGWIRRCDGLLEQFERLEGGSSAAQLKRKAVLHDLRLERQRSGASLALVSSEPPDPSLQPRFVEALRTPTAVRLLWGDPLPTASADWRWPAGFERCDLFLHHLCLPLRASDLRWLQAVPNGLPVWLLITIVPGMDRDRLTAELTSQWPAAQSDRLLFWEGTAEGLVSSLAPLATWLAREHAVLRAATARRCLEELHRRWQADLEGLRRQEWQQLQQRTQWLVAAGVFAAPLPSLDLLVLAIANGLMLQEMARLWDCPWNPEQLRAAALELGRAALAMGVVEWSSQALAAAVKLHGATWLVGGALQALSAAYLTRVVGHAMADMLALSAGVAEPDLAAIRRQAPVLVGAAVEAEKVDWAGFLQQGRRWWQQQQQSSGRAPGPTALHPAS